MLTAYTRSAITGKLCKFVVDCDDRAAVAEAMKEELGKEFKAPVMFSIECGKASLKGQPEPVEVA